MSETTRQALVPLKYALPAQQAVAYVRMSTEHQKYSIFNQLTAIKQYAAEHQLQIVRVYSDEGISGLTFQERMGLQSLIKSVGRGADFGKVLVYDISRWGRFQDPDQGGFYEYFCRMNGVDVIYCAEPFVDDQGPLTSVFKSMKRAMAAEYSRELGVKAFRGACNLAKRGYNQGGGAPYGLRNLVVDPTGKVLRKISLANRKTLRNHHVVLAPGPAREVRAVQTMFHRYVELDESPADIAEYLNKHNYSTRRGTCWHGVTIQYMLGNEKYIGTQVYNQSSARLKAKRRINDRSEWIRKPGAFMGIIDLAMFERAQAKRARVALGAFLPDDDLLTKLRDFIRKHGVVNSKMLGGKNHMPSPLTYKRRFGGMKAAYDLVGYNHYSASYNWNERERLRKLRLSLLARIERAVQCAGEKMVATSSSRFFLGKGLPCSFRLAKSYRAQEVPEKWRVRFNRRLEAELHLIGRLGADGSTVLDYYLIPNDTAKTFPERIGRRNSQYVDQYRCPSTQAVTQRLVAIARSSNLTRRTPDGRLRRQYL